MNARIAPQTVVESSRQAPFHARLHVSEVREHVRDADWLLVWPVGFELDHC